MSSASGGQALEHFKDLISCLSAKSHLGRDLDRALLQAFPQWLASRHNKIIIILIG